jgi:hypothetical protein
LSRLTDLVAQAKAKDPQLGADLDGEFKVLSSRLPFGLNFEHHRPEAVELPQRLIRKGDKVRVLPERGSTKKGDQRLWHVKAISKTEDAKVADLELLGAANTETQSVALDSEYRTVLDMDSKSGKSWLFGLYRGPAGHDRVFAVGANTKRLVSGAFGGIILSSSGKQNGNSGLGGTDGFSFKQWVAQALCAVRVPDRLRGFLISSPVLFPGSAFDLLVLCIPVQQPYCFPYLSCRRSMLCDSFSRPFA